MNTAIYVGLSRQTTLQRALSVVANNIANASTPGFKLESAMVQEEKATPKGAAGPISYVLDTGIVRDFGQGALSSTGAPLDVAIDGDAFFAIQTQAGTRYTRDGRFTLDAQNRLVTQDGDPVLGAGGQPITLNPTAGEPTINQDGSVQQGALTSGRIQAVRFADVSVLSKEGANNFSAPEGTATTPATDARLHQGMVEASNVNTVMEITNLIEISRAYERVAKMMDQAGDLSNRSIERLGSSR